MLNLFIRLYAVLLRLYPQAYRDVFKDEMIQVFADALMDATGFGRRTLAMLCWREARDLPTAIIRERLRESENMKTKALDLFVLIGFAFALTYLGWWSAVHMFGSQSSTSIILPAIIWLFALILIVLAQRTSDWVWIFAGFVILVALCLPDSLVADLFPVPLTQPSDNLVQFTLIMTLCAAIVVTALLIQSGLNLLRWQNASINQVGASPASRKRNGWISVIALALSAIVFAKALHSFYWFMVWDATYDPLGDMWLLFFLVPAVLFSSFVLFVVLSGRTKLISFLYLLFIPVLMIVSASAQDVDFRQLTKERADQVNQAIETFRAREGQYPHALGQLIPWYAISLSNPLILYAQDWCYDGGNDYYRLGYVNRDHWSAPYYGQIYKSNGKIPDLPSICAEEIATLEKRYPGFTGRR